MYASPELPFVSSPEIFPTKISFTPSPSISPRVATPEPNVSDNVSSRSEDELLISLGIPLIVPSVFKLTIKIAPAVPSPNSLPMAILRCPSTVRITSIILGVPVSGWSKPISS